MVMCAYQTALDYKQTFKGTLTIPLVSGCKFKIMEIKSNSEIEEIKAKAWDNGWRLGLLVGSLVTAIPTLIVLWQIGVL